MAIICRRVVISPSETDFLEAHHLVCGFQADAHAAEGFQGVFPSRRPIPNPDALATTNSPMTCGCPWR